MKLSERMWAEWLGGAYNAADWRRGVEDLEAALDDANARAQGLTARCDRLRDVVRARETETLAACAEADELRAERDAAVEASRYANLPARAVAVLHLVYEMREHALRRDHAERCNGIVRAMYDIDQAKHVAWRGVSKKREREMAAMHRRAQSAESRATKLARDAATLRVRLQGAIAKIPHEVHRREHASPCDDINCEWCESPTYMAEYSAATGVLGPIETIPPVALEASDVRVQRANALAARLLESGPDFEDCRWCHGTKQSRNAWAIMCAECNGAGRQRRIKEAALEATSGGNRQAEALHDGARCEREGCANARGYYMDVCDEHGDDDDAKGWHTYLADVPALTDSGDDLARRRVTERAEPTDEEEEAADLACTAHVIKTMNASLVTIAERDARIASLERERDEEAARASAEIDCALRLMGDVSRLERERDEAIARAEQSERRYPATIAHMHDAVARAERAEHERDALDLFRDEQATLINQLLGQCAGWKDRAERAEARIAKVRERVSGMRLPSPHDWSSGSESACRDVLAILDGKEGA